MIKTNNEFKTTKLNFNDLTGLKTIWINRNNSNLRINTNRKLKANLERI